VDVEFGQRHRLSDGLLVRFNGHPNFEAALEAARSDA